MSLFTKKMITESLTVKETKTSKQRKALSPHLEEVKEILEKHKQEGNKIRVYQVKSLLSKALVALDIEKKEYTEKKIKIKDKNGKETTGSFKTYAVTEGVVNDFKSKYPSLFE